MAYAPTCPMALSRRGTPGYISPELEKKMRETYDLQKIDMFAAGMTIADIFVGQEESATQYEDLFGNPLMAKGYELNERVSKEFYFNKLEAFSLGEAKEAEWKAHWTERYRKFKVKSSKTDTKPFGELL